MKYRQDVKYEMNKVIEMSAYDILLAMEELKKTIVRLNDRIEVLESKFN